MAGSPSADQEDLLSRLRVREVAIFCLIALIAVVANLPREWIQDALGVDYAILYGVLGSLVVIALFLYLKFFFFLAVVLLIAGANLPEQIAEGFGISKVPLVLALVAMVGVSLINAVVKLMPTGLEPKPRERSPEGVRAMFYAIERNNPVYAQKVLAMNFDPNLVHENGYTPLAYAALKGNAQLVELFLRYGADPTGKTRDGDTPVELALRKGHTEAADLLRRARQAAEARLAAERPAGAA
ncbi:MAG: ankyrin repeat domain-containing protein [Betaproteobacteria bacterium]|nr:MAG: ankyrin repeat domain-containing protein [Betaproteobacteria bacterium]